MPRRDKGEARDSDSGLRTGWRACETDGEIRWHGIARRGFRDTAATGKGERAHQERTWRGLGVAESVDWNIQESLSSLVY